MVDDSGVEHAGQAHTSATASSASRRTSGRTGAGDIDDDASTGGALILRYHARRRRARDSESNPRAGRSPTSEEILSESTTDWRGQLRIRDLLGDSLRVVARRPVIAFLLPPFAVVFGVALDWGLTGRGAGRDLGWGEFWTQPFMWYATPLLVVLWVLLAWRERSPDSFTVGLGRLASGVLVGLLVVGAYVLGTARTVFVGALVGSVLLTAVPIAACEPGGPIRALRMSVLISRGTWSRILGAWLVLQGTLLLLTVLAAMAYHLAVRPTTFVPVDVRLPTLIEVGLRLGTPLRWTLTMALSIAAYRRLRRSQVAVDIDAWVEVFR